MKKSWLKNEGVQSLLASLICIVLGILFGFIVLLFINPSGALKGIGSVLANFFTYSRVQLQMKNFGNTLAKTAPLLMCALSVLFCYKVGLFNIGAAGQYVVGSCLSIYAALAWGLPWWLCLLLAIVAGALYGALVGLLKAFCNVNEVISGIMLNWVALYTTNMILNGVKEVASPYTFHIRDVAQQSLLPQIGLDKVFAGCTNTTIAIPVSILIAVAVKILLDKTKLGFELKATGINKNAAKYCGMAENRNIVLTLAIGGALAALGGAFLFLTDYEQWSCTQSSVPAMGFNGIAAAFLGGLNPVGTIFSSYFIQHITSGGAYVDKSMYCSQISDLISAVIIYLCGFVGFIRLVMNKAIAAKEEKAKLAKDTEKAETAPQDAENKEGGAK